MSKGKEDEPSSLEGGSFLDDSNIFSVVEVMAETEGAAKID